MSSLRQVAKQAGVSIATASRVVNSPESVRPETRERVERAMKDLLYVTGSATTAENISGLFVPDLLNPSFTHITQAIENASRAAGWSFVLCTTGDDAMLEREHAQQLFTRQISTMVFVSSVAANTAEHQPHYQALLESGARLLFINGAPSKLEAAAVSDDEMASGRIAAEHLVALGHKHIGYVTGTATSSLRSPLRMQGMAQVLREIPGTSLNAMHGEWGVEGGSKTAERILQKYPEITALACASDLTAIGALNYCRSAGIRVPEDISIIGSDGVDAGKWTVPALTTVALPIDAIADFVASWLSADTSNAWSQSGSEMLFRPTLVVRESTSRPATR